MRKLFSAAFSLFLIYQCSSSGARRTESPAEVKTENPAVSASGRNDVQESEFINYRTPVFIDHLGFSVSENPEKMEKKIWKGNIRTDEFKEKNEEIIPAEKIPELRLNISRDLLKSVKEAKITYIRPVRLHLTDISAEPSEAGNAEAQKKDYVSSTVKVEKIRMELFDLDGKPIPSSVTAKSLGKVKKLKLDSSDGNLYFGNNYFIAFKYSKAPGNAEKLILKDENQWRTAVLPVIQTAGKDLSPAEKQLLREAVYTSLLRVNKILTLPRTAYQKLLEEKNLKISEIAGELSVNSVFIIKAEVKDKVWKLQTEIVSASESPIPGYSLNYDLNMEGKTLSSAAAEWETVLTAFYGDPAIRSKISPKTPIDFKDDAAWEKYFQAKELYLSAPNEENLYRAVELLKETASADPEYSEAIALQSLAKQKLSLILKSKGADYKSTEKIRKEGRELADRSAALSPNPSAYRSLCIFFWNNRDRMMQYSSLALDGNGRDADAKFFFLKGAFLKKMYKLKPDSPEVSQYYSWNPNSYAANLFLMELNLYHSAADKALDYMNRILKLNELSDLQRFNLQGYVFRTVKKYDLAKTNYSKALEISAASPEANFGMGQISLAEGGKEKARTYFDRLYNGSSLDEKFLAHKGYGDIAASEGKYDEAVKQYNTVRHLRKYDEEIVFSTVQALISGGKKKEARDILDSVLRSDTDHPEANYFMAAAQEDKSRTEEYLKKSCDSGFKKACNLK